MFYGLFGESKEKKEKREIEQAYAEAKRISDELEALQKRQLGIKNSLKSAQQVRHEALDNTIISAQIYLEAVKIASRGPQIQALGQCQIEAQTKLSEAVKLCNELEQISRELESKEQELLQLKKAANQKLESFGKKPEVPVTPAPQAKPVFVPAKVDVNAEFAQYRRLKQDDSVLGEDGDLKLSAETAHKLEAFYKKRIETLEHKKPEKKISETPPAPHPKDIEEELNHLPKVNFKCMHEQLTSKIGLAHVSVSPPATQKTVVFRATKCTTDPLSHQSLSKNLQQEIIERGSRPKLPPEVKDAIQSRRKLYDGF